VTGRRLAEDERRELCRQVGPIAWVVLEELVSVSAPDDLGLVARSNVRQLALDLGLSKDTAARAVRRLAAAGLVERTASQRTDHGRFGSTGYRLDAARLRLVDDHGPPVSRTRVRAKPSAQATLFDTGSTGGRP
jgi:hypothetical protein